MLYMVIEEFRNEDALPVYRRLQESGRELPEGLTYVNSWVTADLTRCYQIMECGDRALLDEWMSKWDDLVRFDVVAVVTSSDAAESFSSRL